MNTKENSSRRKRTYPKENGWIIIHICYDNRHLNLNKIVLPAVNDIIITKFIFESDIKSQGVVDLKQNILIISKMLKQI